METNKPFKVEFSEEAIEDLEQIRAFLTRLFSKSIAQTSIEAVFNRCIQLEQFPFAGRRERVTHIENEDIRYAVLKKSRIQYKVSGTIVHIIRIQDTRQHPFTFTP